VIPFARLNETLASVSQLDNSRMSDIVPFRCTKPGRTSAWAPWAVLTAFVVGCSGANQATVQGTVVTSANKPLVGARVIARLKDTGVSVTGGTDASGRFVLATSESQPNLPAGEYEVIVVEDLGPMDAQRQPSIAMKYRDAATSGLAFTAAPGEAKEVNWTLDAL
jgi:hypothetical protein